jgi:hypothetical protein
MEAHREAKFARAYQTIGSVIGFTGEFMLVIVWEQPKENC